MSGMQTFANGIKHYIDTREVDESQLPDNLPAGSLLIYDGTDWVSITKETLIEEIIAALPTWTGGSY